MPVSVAWREGRIGSMVESFAARPAPPDARAVERAIREGLDFPPFHPPVQSWSTGSDGTSWLRREDEDAAGGRGDAHWLVVESDGTPRGEVRLPSGARIGWISRDVIWTVEQDTFDVPWLVRYRVQDP